MSAEERRFHNTIQLILDILLTKVIWLCTIQVRIQLNPLLQAHVKGDLSSIWAPPIGLILCLWVATSLRFRLYQAPQKIGFWSIQVSAFENAAVMTLLTAVVTFFELPFGPSASRMFVPSIFPVSFLVLLLSRCLALIIAPLATGKATRIALIGEALKGSQWIEQMHAAEPDFFLGLIVPQAAPAEACLPAGDLAASAASVTGSVKITGSVKMLGATSQLAEIINRERLDRVMILDGSLGAPEREHCSKVLNRMGLPYSYVLEVAARSVPVDVHTSYGLPLVELRHTQFTARQERIKRLFDIVVSAATLVVLLPLLLLIAALIKLTSDGPVLYRSPRIGKGGRYFTFLKFRSMCMNNDRSKVDAGNEKTGHIFKMKNDPRVTTVGRYIRRYSLDELPQLINILRGEMSIVGPRPLPAGDLGLDGMSQTFWQWSEGRASVQPGLTGLWQVSGRSDLPFEEMVRLDLAYVQNWSLALDIRIILDTPMLVLRGAGAY